METTVTTPGPAAERMSNGELGALLGCSNSMASRLRAGKRLPGLDTLARVHREFGVSWDELFDARSAGPEAFGVLLTRAIAQHQADADPA